MAELAKANGIKVVLASVMPVTDAIRPQTERRRLRHIRALNAWIKDYASKTGAVYLDYYSAMVDDKGMLKTELTYDGLHPNDAGYVVIEPLAQNAIDAGCVERLLLPQYRRTCICRPTSILRPAVLAA